MMKRFLRKAARLLLVLMVLAPVFLSGAFALCNEDPLIYAQLDRAEFEFDYIPPTNSDYALYVFSDGSGEVSARGEILEDGAVIASGEGSGEICSAWLVAGKRYTLRVKGAGRAVVEVARSALSRCYNLPLEAEEETRAQKMIARAFDAHWYRFTARESGRLMLSFVPEDAGLRLSAMLFDGAGVLISEFEDLEGGACLLLVNTRAGEDYYLRVYSPMGQEGYYSLNLNRREEGIPVALNFEAHEYSLAAGGTLNLSALLNGKALIWDVSDNSVAAVDQTGLLRGLQPGETRVTAYGIASRAEVTVQVELVPLESISIAGRRLSLSAGDTVDVQIDFTPENASERRLKYKIADPEIASVSPRGVLKGLQPGRTTLTVSSVSGNLSDSIDVIVAPAAPRYRALLVGEQSYPFAESTARKGSDNSIQALSALLQSGRFESAAWTVDAKADLSKAELLAEIRRAFSDATEQDVSLFYITCHGNYTGGMSFLELSDGSSLAMRDLERELRAIPGTVVVMIDCCGSGGAIGAVSERLAFANGITGAFSGAAVRGSKYKVLTSAALDEDSFRVAFNGEADAGVMATAFVRALCDGMGWNIDTGAPGTMGADRNFDGSITLDEIFLYMRGRVNWYLDTASALTGNEYRQSVQVYPRGDPFVLFERKN